MKPERRSPQIKVSSSVGSRFVLNESAADKLREGNYVLVIVGDDRKIKLRPIQLPGDVVDVIRLVQPQAHQGSVRMHTNKLSELVLPGMRLMCEWDDQKKQFDVTPEMQ